MRSFAYSLLFFTAAIFPLEVAFAAPTVDADWERSEQDFVAQAEEGPLLAQRRQRGRRNARIAQRGGRGNNQARRGRGRNPLVVEGRVKSRGDQKVIDFDDAVDIDGRRKTPLGLDIGGSRNRGGSNFIDIRTEWRDMMKQTATNINGE